MSNNNHYALITGGTSGIGYELAKLFARDGYNLIIVARNRGELERSAIELKKLNKINVVKISTDLFDPGNAFELYDTVVAKGLKVDVLVNDAGQGLYGEFQYTDVYRELNIIQLNISSLVILTKKFLRYMLENGGGKILNVAAIAGKVPGPLQSVYHGTKAFVHSFTEAVRQELKNSNVSVTSLLPGATATDFFNKAGMQHSKIVREAKLADPAEVAKDGYEALMEGRDIVIPGTKNKIQVAMSNMMPDSVASENIYKQQTPALRSY